MFAVLYQRGIHNDEGVGWFPDETAAMSYAIALREYGTHWYVVLQRNDNEPYNVVTEWGIRK